MPFLTITGHTAQFSGQYNGGLTTSQFGLHAYAEDGSGNNYLITNISSEAPSSFLFNDGFPAVGGGSFQLYQTGKSGEMLAFAEGGFSADYVTITNIPQDVAPVPGPMVGAGIPGLLALFGMGGLYWRRKQLAG